jgi:hypothetical protein
MTTPATEARYVTGILKNWKPTGYGFVRALSNRFPIQEYYIHAKMIKHGPNPPPAGSMVRFEPGPPQKGGTLPTAQNAWIIDEEFERKFEASSQEAL